MPLCGSAAHPSDQRRLMGLCELLFACIDHHFILFYLSFTWNNYNDMAVLYINIIIAHQYILVIIIIIIIIFSLFFPV